jgi:hypothetical protein
VRDCRDGRSNVSKSRTGAGVGAGVSAGVSMFPLPCGWGAGAEWCSTSPRRPGGVPGPRQTAPVRGPVRGESRKRDTRRAEGSAERIAESKVGSITEGRARKEKKERRAERKGTWLCREESCQGL